MLTFHVGENCIVGLQLALSKTIRIGDTEGHFTHKAEGP